MSTLKHIAEALLASDFKTRDTALQQLSTLSSIEKVEEVLILIVEDRKPEVYEILLRDLARFSPPVAGELLKNFCIDPRTADLPELADAVAKLPRNEKVTTCIWFLEKTPNRALVFRAVGILGDTRDERSIFPLLNLFRKSDDLELITACAKAFRSMRDIRLVAPIIHILRRIDDENARFELLLTLSELALIFPVRKKTFLSYLESPGSKVRRVAILSLARTGNEKIYRHAVRHLAREKDPRVRAEILKHLEKFPSRENIEVLLNTVEHSSSDGEILAAETVLETIPDIVKAPVFRKHIRRKSSPRSRALLCRELGRMGLEKDIPLLLKIYRNDPEEGVRSQAVEALGHYRDSEVDRILARAVHEKDPVAYNATLALCQKFAPGRQEIFTELLNEQQTDMEIIHQTILSCLSNLFRNEKATLPIKETLLRLLRNENINVRYLATQALADCGDRRMIPELLDLAADEEIFQVREAAEKAVHQLAGTNYTWLLEVLEARSEHLILVTRLVLEMTLSRSEKYRLMVGLTERMNQAGRFREFLDTLTREEHSDIDSSSYLRLMIDQPLGKESTLQMIHFLQSQPLDTWNEELSSGLLLFFKKSNGEIRTAMAELFQRTRGQEKRIFRLWSDEPESSMKELLHKVLLELCRKDNG